MSEEGVLQGNMETFPADLAESGFTVRAGTVGPDLQPAGDCFARIFSFAESDHIPNSRLPLLAYRNVREGQGERLAVWLEKTFGLQGWRIDPRHSIHNFTHFHSTCHEVFGVYQGTATLQFGASAGVTLNVRPGDVFVIPAGVAHRRLGNSPDFGALGAYPVGQHPDLLRGTAEGRAFAEGNIARVPLPEADPIFGAAGQLVTLWKPGAGVSSRA